MYTHNIFCVNRYVCDHVSVSFKRFIKKQLENRHVLYWNEINLIFSNTYCRSPLYIWMLSVKMFFKLGQCIHVPSWFP